MTSRWKGTEKERAYGRAYYLRNKERIKLLKQKWWQNKEKFIAKTANYLFNVYKQSSKKRGYTFTLTRSDFEQIISKPCNYCGASGEPFIGIDRVNNEIGYQPENCVSCCHLCNRMKFKSTPKEFLERCIQIVQYSKQQK